MPMEYPFDIHQVADRLWVGPCPSSPERILKLKQTGISGLVSVQTDGDLEACGMAWPLMWRFLMTQGINATRLPITDFDDKALLLGITQAVDAVAGTLSEGRSGYLHCTAGINRSPTVAIGYLARYGGLSLDAAWDQVCTRRKCMPNRTVLQRWWTQNGPA